MDFGIFTVCFHIFQKYMCPKVPKSAFCGKKSACGSAPGHAKLFACLISWLGACLQVRCPVWRLQLTKEHNTRTPHKRAQHTHATQKEMYGYYAREKI